MNKAKRYSPEVKERAVRLLFENEKDYRSRWAATMSIAPESARNAPMVCASAAAY